MTQSPSSKRNRQRGDLDEQYDAIVVGSGMGGLVTGALLAQNGLRALVLDSHYVAGGNATVFRRKKYEFDVGVHYIGECGPGETIPRILAACGVDDIKFNPMSSDVEKLIFPDLEFAIPADRDLFRDRLIKRFPEEEKGIRRYISFLEQVDRAGKAERTGKRLTMAGAILRSPLLIRYANTNFAAFLDSCTQDPRLRSIITAQHGTYSISPRAVSSVLHAGLQNHYFSSGGWYPEGGGQIMADRLADAIEEAGGQVRLCARVDQIIVEDGRATGVVVEAKHAGTRELRAPIVISNADIKKTFLDLLPREKVPKVWRRRAEQWSMALPLFVVYLGVELAPEEIPYDNSNVLLYGGYDIEGEYDQLNAGELPSPLMVYVSTASLKDKTNPRMAPPGHSNFELMTVVPGELDFWGTTAEELADDSYRKNPTYRAKKEQIQEDMIDRFSEVIPDLRERIRFKEAATPISHSRYVRSTWGTGYGLACTPRQFLKKRPEARTPIKGLYLCGASCRSGHGIVGAMISGVMAADAILKKGLIQSVLN